MKISMTLLASALASLAAAETAGSKGCGFVETPEFARMTAEMALQEANGDFVESAQPIEADVYFHVVSAGQSVSDGNVPENKLHEQFAVLKNVYDRYGVNFTLKGITRTVNPSWATDSSYENEVAMKGALRKGDYDALNVFFVKELNGFNGYCRNPTANGHGPGSIIRRIDGCTLAASTVPGGSPPRHLGLSTVHEVGHWMGLRHTYVGGCDGVGDGVDDTPPQSAPTEGCPIGRDSCPGGGPDPIHNYMDLSSDECRTEFTPGQRTRMHNSFNMYRRKI